MSRRARIISNTGIYHIMLRGINRQQIFLDEEDNKNFLDVLKAYKEECGYKILAYCLMGNHVHLLLKEGSERLAQVFKRIGAKYVYWYNSKYQRVGHLFQGRFKSEPVESERYFCTVICYIHQNPVKAGICKSPELYPYSSMSEYLGEDRLIDTDCINQFYPIRYLAQQSKVELAENCMEMSNTPSHRITDQEVLKMMKELTNCCDPSSFQKLPISDQERYLSKLRKKGVPIRQLNRLTGLSCYTIRKRVGAAY